MHGVGEVIDYFIGDEAEDDQQEGIYEQSEELWSTPALGEKALGSPIGDSLEQKLMSSRRALGNAYVARKCFQRE